MAGILH